MPGRTTTDSAAASGLNVSAGALGGRQETASGTQWIAAAQERIRAAVASGSALNIEGAGTRRDFGGPAHGEPLCCAGYSGILAYDPGDLVVTVRAGTPLQALEAELSRHGQMLGFEPPQRPGSTVGGAVALGWAGRASPLPARCATTCSACACSMAVAATCASAARSSRTSRASTWRA